MTTLRDSNGIRFASSEVVLAKDLDDVAAFYRQYTTVQWTPRATGAMATAADYNSLLQSIKTGLGDNFIVTLPPETTQTSEIVAVVWGTPVKKYVPPPKPVPQYQKYMYFASNTYRLTLDADTYLGSTVRWTLATGGGGGCGAQMHNGVLTYGSGGGAGSLYTGTRVLTRDLINTSSNQFILECLVEGIANGGGRGGPVFDLGGANGCGARLAAIKAGGSVIVIDGKTVGGGGARGKVIGTRTDVTSINGDNGHGWDTSGRNTMTFPFFVPSQFPRSTYGGLGGVGAHVSNSGEIEVDQPPTNGSGVCAGGGAAACAMPSDPSKRNDRFTWSGANGTDALAYIEIIPPS